MFKSFTLFLLTLFVCVTCLAQDQTSKTKTEQNSLTIRVETTLVNVPVAVLSREGKFIPNLRRDDFQLFEDGVAQEITHFKSAEEPVTLALLLDISDSAKIKFDEIKQAAVAFTDQLRQQDRAMVVVFDARVKVLIEATDNKALIREVIAKAVSGGGTSVYDAVDLTLQNYLNRIQGRKAVVVFTDGVDLHSQQATAESTLALAEEQDAPIYVIRYDTFQEEVRLQLPGPPNMSGISMRDTPGKKEYEIAKNYLQALSEVSGGRYFFADKLDHLKESFAQIAEELKQQYVLGYYPTNLSASKKRREIKVKVAAPNSAVRARKHYIFKSGAEGKTTP